MRRGVACSVVVGLFAALLLPVSVSARPARPGPDPSFRRAGAATVRGPARPIGTLATDPAGLALAKARANAAAAGGLETAGTVTATPTAGLGWNGQSDARVAPPDSTGAIGPDRYVQLVNLRFGIYQRDGSLLSQGNLSTLTGIADDPLFGPCLSDPQVIWDVETQRFTYVALDVCANALAFGISRTATPADGSGASWCKYEGFNYGFSLPDYPKLGDSRDLILIGANIFTLGLLYAGSDVMWIDKTSLAAAPGSCPKASGFRAGSFSDVRDAFGVAASTPVPANVVDPAGEGYVVSAPDVSEGPADHLTLLHVVKDAGSGAVSIARRDTLPVASFSVPAVAPQRNANKTLDTLDGRLTMAVAAVDPSIGATAVWTTHAVFGGAGSAQRWYELDASTGTIARQGTVSDPSLSIFNGAISPDRAATTSGGSFGDAMVLGFNTSSSSTFPAIRMVSRVGDGPTSRSVAVVSSAGKNVDFSCSPTCRWGDYSGASPDPAADPDGAHGSVWLTNQFNRKSLTKSDIDWRTRIWSATP